MGQKTTAKSKKRDVSPGADVLEDATAAFEAGSYAGLRRFVLPDDATPEMKAELQRLKDTVAIDKAQLAVGIGALIVVVFVGFLTLHT